MQGTTTTIIIESAVPVKGRVEWRSKDNDIIVQEFDGIVQEMDDARVWHDIWHVAEEPGFYQTRIDKTGEPIEIPVPRDIDVDVLDNRLWAWCIED